MFDRAQTFDVLAGASRGRCRNREHGGVFRHHRISAGSDSVCDINRHSIGLAQTDPAHHDSNWRSPRLHTSWLIDCQVLRTGAMGRGDGGRSSNGCDAPEWHISSTRLSIPLWWSSIICRGVSSLSRSVLARCCSHCLPLLGTISSPEALIRATLGRYGGGEHCY